MKTFIRKIERINWGLLSPENIRKMSVVRVETPDTYDSNGYPIENGLMDPRLGVLDSSLKCPICGETGGKCKGHFGSIELARPVIHAGFAEIIHNLLKSTCNKCGRVLLNPDEINYFTERMNNALENKENISNVLKEIYGNFKRKNKENDEKYCCPYCGLPQESITLDKPASIFQDDYKLTPHEIRKRLKRITDEDMYILGINPKVARPEWLVLSVLPVPSLFVRPPIILDNGERSEDDLTHKLVDILRINQRLIENTEAGAPPLIVEDLNDLLQYHVTTYFDNEASGVPPSKHRSGRPLKTLKQRLKGKNGRFQSNLSGKVVNFSARTVITPDPNININEVGVPKIIAKEVTVPTYVNEWNMDEIKKYIENGPNVHPGANYMIATSGNKRKINDITKKYILENLKPGDIIERHLKDGDMVLLNHKPSIHRMSMMAHEVKILPYKTFRLNPCVCPPYNASFDGNEMNMHVLQSDESRAESKSLMQVQQQIISPRFGRPIIGAIKDHISGLYLLTRKSVKISEEKALQIIHKSNLEIPEKYGEKWLLKSNHVSPEIKHEIDRKMKNTRVSKLDKENFLKSLNLSKNERISRLRENNWTDEEKEAINYFVKKRILKKILLQYSFDDDSDSLFFKKDGEDWTGKELFSLLLPNEFNLVYKAEICNKCGHCDKILSEDNDDVDFDNLCPIDAYVIIENGILKQGVIDKKSCGVMSGEILLKIFKDYGSKRAMEFLDKSTRLALCGIMIFGMTTSLNDFEIPNEFQLKINEQLQISKEKVDELIDAYDEGNSYGNLEMKINNILSEVRYKSEELIKEYLTLEDNPAAVMTLTGAGSSTVNLTQINSCIGQQLVRGERINRGYIERTLPHFKRKDVGLKAKGFIYSNYKSGLDPIEYFFHAIGGRDNSVDAAIRGVSSGYMQRKLTHALHDVYIQHSGIVTDSKGTVIQRVFGDDGVDPAKSDFGRVADLDELINEIKLEKNSDIGDISKIYNKIKVSKTKKKIKKPSKNTRAVSPEDLKKLDDYVKTIDIEMENLKNSEINLFINKYPDFKDSIKDVYIEYNNLLNEIKSKKNEILSKKEKLINNSIIIFNIKSYDYVEEYPSKVKELLARINNEIEEIKKSDEFLNKVNRPQLILRREKLIYDIERYIDSINDSVKEYNKKVLSKSILNKINKLINDLETLIGNLNNDYDSYIDFKSNIDKNESSFKNLKSEFLLIEDKLNQELNRYLLLEYQILFDEEIISKDEFNELKKEL